MNPIPPDDDDSGALAPPPPVSRVADRARAPGPRLGPDVLRRVKERDPGALAEFFETYFDRVYALVSRLLGDRTQAEGAVSEVFLKVHRAIDRPDPARDPMPWLVTIAELPDDLRESVLPYDYADQSHEEIAAALGITHDAARKRHSRALVALGRALKERLA